STSSTAVQRHPQFVVPEQRRKNGHSVSGLAASGVSLMALRECDPSTSVHLFARLVDPAQREDAWRLFLTRYGPLIARWCRGEGVQAADVEDVSQTVVLKLSSALRGFTYDPARSFRAYLRSAVLNTVRSLWAGQARRPGTQGSGDPNVAEL